MQRRGSTWIPLVAACVVLAVAVAVDAWPWMGDDTFISLRYSERLLEGRGLTWNDGERVEGYSNLSWVLLTAALGWLGLDLITAVRLLGIACTIGTFVVLDRVLLAGAPLVARCVTVLLGAQGTVALWAIGGLEAPLAMLCVGLGAAGLVRGLDATEAPERARWWRCTGAAFALLVLTRPDGPLWVATAVLLLWWFRGRYASHAGWRGVIVPALWVALPAFTMWVAQTGFRVAYFGDWVANTTRAKLAPTLLALPFGLEYLASAAEALRSVWLPALAGALLAFRDRAARPLVVYTLVTLPLWCAYIASIGGDYFPRNRVMVPTLLPVAGLAGFGLVHLARRGGTGRALAWTALLACTAWARFDAWWLPQVPVALPKINRQELSQWEWRGIAEGDWLRRAFAAQQPVLAMDQVGAVPYASRLPCIDMLGLCDRTVASTPIEAERIGTIGHARGNGPYVLAKQPDLVLFLPPPHSPAPSYASGTQMESEPRFLADYRVVLFEVDGFDRELCAADELIVTGWLRVDGRIGVRRDGDRLRVPGYLFGSYRQPRPLRIVMAPPGPESPDYPAWVQDVQAGWAFLAARNVVGVLDPTAGCVVGEVRAPGTHRLRQLPLPAGRYRLECPGLPPGVTLAIAEPDGDAFPLQDGAFVVAQTGFDKDLVDLVLDVPPGTGLPLRVPSVEVVRRR